MVPDLMRIGELATAAGVSTRTIDFYTSLGLIQPAQRTSGGYRLYDPATVELIGSIRKLEASGMGLDEIAKLRASAAADDLGEIVAKLGQEVEALRALAESAGPTAHSVATTLAVRAHHLIAMASELLIARPDL